MTDTTANAAADLEANLAGVHVPEQSADAEELLLKAGLALPVIGVVLIIVAWYQAAGTAFVADQVPMLISGGLLGLALALIGIGLFVRISLARVLRFWLARTVAEQQAQADRVIEALAGVEAAVRAATTDAPVVVQVNDSGAGS